MGRGTCPQALLPVFDQQEPDDGRREPTLVNCSLTSAYKCHACTRASPPPAPDQIHKSVLQKRKKQGVMVQMSKMYASRNTHKR